MQLGLISNASLSPNYYWTTLVPPLFSGFSGHPGVRTIAPPPLAWERRKEWMAVRSQLKGCDSLFWVQLSSRPSAPIHLASYLRLGARRSNYVVDAWKRSLTKIGVIATLERLDPCFVSYREATVELRRRFPRAKFVWLPFGAHTDTFYPRKQGKPIFAFWMGRRYEPLHQALLAYCEARGLRYVYSRGGVGMSTQELGEMASSAQYFVATPPDIDHPERTGGFSPLVMRYFEGLAAGTRLLGVLPKSGEYEALLPTDAFCQVAADGSDLAERLDEDRSRNTQRAVDDAAAFVHEHHSWRRRAEQVFNHLAYGAAIDLPLLQKEPQIDRVVSRVSLPRDLRTTERLG